MCFYLLESPHCEHLLPRVAPEGEPHRCVARSELVEPFPGHEHQRPEPAAVADFDTHAPDGPASAGPNPYVWCPLAKFAFDNSMLDLLSAYRFLAATDPGVIEKLQTPETA